MFDVGRSSFNPLPSFMNTDLDISVIICTHNRAESLTETLNCLAKTDRNGLKVEIVVVDNNSKDKTVDVIRSFADRLPIRYFFESRQGKSFALNRALCEGGLGKIIVILDDDMSPQPDWFQGVAAISARWPNHNVFTGRCYIIWPFHEIPKWALNKKLHSWIFSVNDWTMEKDSLLKNGQWPLGGHFWFRSRVLDNGRKFAHVWATEPKFTLQLAEEGHDCVMGPDAVTGHRIQPELLIEKNIRERAVLVGKEYANARLRPYMKVKQAILLKRHPILTRVFCAVSLLRWSIVYCFSQFVLSHDIRFERSVIAIERIANYFEMLRIAKTVEEEWKADETAEGNTNKKQYAKMV